MCPVLERSSSAARLTLGVLGGLGPQATVDFLAKLVAATPAQVDQDHLRVLVNINPETPDRNAALAGNGPSPANVLVEMAKTLHGAGADYLVVICNTAHAFFADISSAVPIPFVSLIEEACDETTRHLGSGRAVGLLATSACIESGVYQRSLAARGCASLTLDTTNQAALMNLIYQIKSGDQTPSIRNEAIRLAERLAHLGADIVVAACTEIPLVLHPNDLPLPLIDPTLNLARRCVRYSLRQEGIPGSRWNALARQA